MSKEQNPLFSEFTWQSKKGILVIYFNKLRTLLKASWVVVLVLFTKISQLTTPKMFALGGIVLFIFLVLLVIAFWSYKNFKFKIADGHFILHKGILRKSNIAVPFDRIQHINFKQNVVQQLIGVYQVDIETTGSTDTEITIKALNYNQAQALKKALIGERKSTVTTTTDKEESKTFLKIPFSQLFKVAITENHLKSLLVFMALLFGFYQQARDVLDRTNYKAVLNDLVTTEQVQESFFSSFTSGLLIFLLVFLVLSVIAVLSSVIRVFLFHFDLTAFLEKHALEIQQGLLTKKKIALHKEKVQSITISTNPLKKLLGISFVTFKQAVSGSKSQRGNKAIRLVGCKEHHITQIQEFLFTPTQLIFGDTHQMHQYYKSRMYVRVFGAIALFNIISFWLFTGWLIAIANLILIPLCVVLVRLKYQKTTLQMNNEVLLFTNGMLETHYTLLPLFKVQYVRIKQSIFQKRRAVVDLVLQTASGKITIPCLEEEKAQKIYNYTLYKVATNELAWM